MFNHRAGGCRVHVKSLVFVGIEFCATYRHAAGCDLRSAEPSDDQIVQAGTVDNGVVAGSFEKKVIGECTSDEFCTCDVYLYTYATDPGCAGDPSSVTLDRGECDEEVQPGCYESSCMLFCNTTNDCTRWILSPPCQTQP
jgi:hypothetical protein